MEKAGLNIFTENELYIIELGGPSDTLRKEFGTKQEMLEALDAYRYIMNDVDTTVSKDLFGSVVKYLSQGASNDDDN